MFFVYLFAAVAGCLLVLVSLVGGAHHDNSAVGDADPLVGAAHDAAGTDSAGASHSHPADAAAGHPAGLGVALGWLLSVQLWTYLLAFGGLTGLLLRTVAHLPEPLAGGWALGVGLSTALGARAVLRRVLKGADSGTTSHERLVGSSAQVLIPAEPGGTGKIRLTARGQLLDLLARASDGGALPAAARVSILDVRDGVAEVLREDAPPAPAAQQEPATAAAVESAAAPVAASASVSASASASSSAAGAGAGGPVPPALRHPSSLIKG